MTGSYVSQFEYRGWQVKIEIEGASELTTWYASLSYQGKHACRVSLSTKMDPGAARWALDSKACDFIDEWSLRPRAGDGHIRER